VCPATYKPFSANPTRCLDTQHYHKSWTERAKPYWGYGEMDKPDHLEEIFL
jgi:hypothetical protein